MKDNGFTLVESILGLTMFFVIFSTLIPIVHTMYRNIENKKVQLHAMISNLDAVIEHQNDSSKLNGMFLIENRRYSWYLSENRICTHYEIEGIGKTTCVNMK